MGIKEEMKEDAEEPLEAEGEGGAPIKFGQGVKQSSIRDRKEEDEEEEKGRKAGRRRGMEQLMREISRKEEEEEEGKKEGKKTKRITTI